MRSFNVAGSVCLLVAIDVALARSFASPPPSQRVNISLRWTALTQPDAVYSDIQGWSALAMANGSKIAVPIRTDDMNESVAYVFDTKTGHIDDLLVLGHSWDQSFYLEEPDLLLIADVNNTYNAYKGANVSSGRVWQAGQFRANAMKSCRHPHDIFVVQSNIESQTLGFLQGRSKRTGRILWDNFNVDFQVSLLAFWEDDCRGLISIFTQSATYYFSMVDLTTGKILWNVTVPEELSALSEGALLTDQVNGTVHWVVANSNWTFALASLTSSTRAISSYRNVTLPFPAWEDSLGIVFTDKNGFVATAVDWTNNNTIIFGVDPRNDKVHWSTVYNASIGVFQWSRSSTTSSYFYATTSGASETSMAVDVLDRTTGVILGTQVFGPPTAGVLITPAKGGFFLPISATVVEFYTV